MQQLAGVLRPGGWLVVDDYDLHTISIIHPPDAVWAKVISAATNVLQSAGADVGFGRRLPSVLRTAGLTEVGAEGQVLLQSAPDGAPWLLPILARMREPMIGSGVVSAAELDQVVGDIKDRDCALSMFLPTMVSARGRRG